MTAIATILEPGLLTTVQDAGRPGYRHLGVPRAGAADRLSLACANAVIGNPLSATALETTLSGPALRFERDISFSIAGADMHATLNGEAIKPCCAFTAKKNDTLAMGAAKIGARSYIAFQNGVAGDEFLQSASTYLPAGIGGGGGRALAAGDILNSAALGAGPPRAVPQALQPAFAHDFILRATAGPDADLVTADSIDRFFAHSFEADRRADRMGLRLAGVNMALAGDPVMASSAVFPGTVQCPPDGAPFLLLADAQTVGGYPRIAQVIAADLPLAGQIRPGDHVWFRKVSEEKGRDITLQRQALIAASLPGFSFY